jgi:hypothetical protein
MTTSRHRSPSSERLSLDPAPLTPHTQSRLFLMTSGRAMDANDESQEAKDLIAYLDALLERLGPDEEIERLSRLRANFGPDGFVTVYKTDYGMCFPTSRELLRYYKLRGLFEALHGSHEDSVQQWVKSKLKKLRRQKIERDRAKEQTRLHELIHATMCSDVHLGTKHSHKDAFYRWLSEQVDRKLVDRRIILMGDILDL